tara:strand:- start:928 stop:1956 length:1029 start_codon:yes stop_codon:yes gene_type:complete
MNYQKGLTLIGALALVGLITFSAPASAAGKIYLSDTAVPGGSAHSMMVAFAKMAKRAGVNIQINAGKTLTVSMMQAGKGKIDFYTGVPFFYLAMSKRLAMFKKQKSAPAAAKNIRYIFSYPAGLTHILVYANSGMKTMSDFKGKKIFLGPPAGAATWEAKTQIKAATGYESGKDYQGVILNWGEGIQAMKDKKIDVLFRPIQLGSALIEQFGLTDSFRLISLPDQALKTKAMKDMLSEPDYMITKVKPNTYRGQKNTKAVSQLGYYLFVGTQASVPADDVYKATKAFWTNISEVHATAKFMEDLKKSNAFDAVNGPLHIGAYKYYKEAGFKIPDSAIPPEAK